jgi:drug/metabolite transporter (DMT)-like permease
MNPLHYFLITIGGFGLWPVLMRFANPLPPAWVTAAISLITFAIGLGAATKGKEQFYLIPFCVALVIGILNGISTITYARLIGWGSAEGTRYVPIVAATLPVIMFVIGVIVFRDKVQWYNWFGLGVVVVGIGFMNLK